MNYLVSLGHNPRFAITLSQNIQPKVLGSFGLTIRNIFVFSKKKSFQISLQKFSQEDFFKFFFFYF